MSIEISHVIEIRQKNGKWKPFMWFSENPCWYNNDNHEPGRLKQCWDYVVSFPKWHKAINKTWKDIPVDLKRIWVEHTNKPKYPYDKAVRIKGKNFYPQYVVEENDITFRDVFMRHDSPISDRGIPTDMSSKLKKYITSEGYRGYTTHYTLNELENLLNTYEQKLYNAIEKFNHDRNIYEIGKKIGVDVAEPLHYGDIEDCKEELGYYETLSLYHLYYSFSGLVETVYGIVSNNDIRITSWTH